MREGIGSIALYNIIIIFIFITFSVLAGTMSYSKAFKSNNRIINAIEKYEGYNELSATSINQFLSSIGYQLDTSNSKCADRLGAQAMGDLNPNYRFCVYAYPVETKTHNGQYVTYGVVTYIYIDMPVIGEFLRIPIFGKSNRVFCFGNQCSNYIETLE